MSGHPECQHGGSDLSAAPLGPSGPPAAATRRTGVARPELDLSIRGSIRTPERPRTTPPCRPMADTVAASTKGPGLARAGSEGIMVSPARMAAGIRDDAGTGLHSPALRG